MLPSRPLHLVIKVRRSVWKLRDGRCFRTLERALIAGCRRFGFRIVHFFVKAHRIHLIVEVEDRLALFRGMQGLGVRVARSLNREMGRSGAVLEDRYVLRTLNTVGDLRAVRNFMLIDLEHPPVTSSLPPLDPYRTTLGALVRARSWMSMAAPP